MKITRITPILVVLFLFFISIEVSSTPLSFFLSAGEGGAQTDRAINSFEQYMADNECTVKVEFSNDGVKGSLYFSATPFTSLSKNSDRYELLNGIRTYKDYPLTTTVLVKSSTGITELKSAEGERISVISDSSYLGYDVVQGLYKDANVVINEKDVYFTEFYEGATTLLLHGDVFVAAIPGPLARRWASANDLSIIAESDPLDLGEVLISLDIEPSQKQLCKDALVKLKRTTRRDKRMNVFPAWVEGFK